jgi:hypothetical protein
MVFTSTMLLKNYFWKYVDMNINCREIEYLLEQTLVDKDCEQFLERYKERFSNPSADLRNVCTLLSHLSTKELSTLLQFYHVQVNMINNNDLLNTPSTLKTYADLEQFIGKDHELFDVFVVSLYYYF